MRDIALSDGSNPIISNVDTSPIVPGKRQTDGREKSTWLDGKPDRAVVLNAIERLAKQAESVVSYI